MANSFSQKVKTYLDGFKQGSARQQGNKSYQIEDLLDNENPVYKYFDNVSKNRDELIKSQSVSAVHSKQSVLEAYFSKNSPYHVFIYSNNNNDKYQRLKEYRRMACFPEVSNALDEYCDEFVEQDEHGSVVNLEINNEDLNELQAETLIKEFKRISSYFDFKHNGWHYIRELLVEGEVYWENIINKERPAAGILGVYRVPTELIDPLYINNINDEIKSFILKKPVLDENDPTQIKEYKLIPFDENQITYVHSHIWNDTKTYRVPFIENARESYRKLSLIEDSIIIYRLIRAPEKLMFNIDVGEMAPADIDAYMRRMQEDYWGRKTFDSVNGGPMLKYNPQSMSDAFWFPKAKGQEGSSVSVLPGGQNLGELKDLDYFKERLYESLKVPRSRLNKDAQQNVNEGTIQHEELSFAKSVIRLQSAFAQAIKRTFLNHLKLKGLYNEYELREYHLDVKFVEPSTYFQMRKQQILSIKMDNYSQALATGKIADLWAKKMYLEMTDHEIKAERAARRLDAEFDWEIQQITQLGPDWRNANAAMQETPAGGPGGGGAPGGAAPGGGSPSTPPEFGDIGGGGETDQAPSPEGGETPPPAEPQAE